MTLKLLLNYPEKERISTHILDFFWSELAYARLNNDHELWVVSPWITESSFDLSDRKLYEDLWPGFSKSSIQLSYVLKKFIDLGSSVNLVCRPPHMLVPLFGFLNYHNNKKKMDRIEQLFEELTELQGKIAEITAGQKRVKSDIQSATSELYSVFAELQSISDMLRGQARGQSDVLVFAKELKDYGADKVQICYNYRLHAKILVGKLGGFFGSANITYSGFNYNDELFAYFYEKEAVAELRSIAKSLAETGRYWWRRKSSEYSPRYEYRRQIGDEALEDLLGSKGLPNEMKEALQLLGMLV